MSVYCTSFVLDGEGPWDDDTDLGAPIIYRESHILPSDTDPRGGSLDLASIPAFLTRDGYDNGVEDGDVWPFLRVSLRAAGDRGDHENTIVLDHAQVVALRDELTAWLGRVDPACPTRRRTGRPA